ncbi:MAG TPA: SDR family NAD(P)-dependent oxidoreductase [Lacunisphaera sp.]|nr:SDR family NAD(P)-dependent oxidoreductase [Lacunisphaera sp.]
MSGHSREPSPANFDFDGRVAVVTGGAQGIGLAVCRTLHAAGADLVIADVSADRARASAAEFRERPPLVVPTDVSSASAVSDLFAATLARFGQVDIVVNSAGIYRKVPILDIEVADWDLVMAVNLRGTFLVGREAVRAMRPRQRGRIINVASIAGKVGHVTAGAHYSASKAGVISFTKTLAHQAAPFKINVNCVCPGPIATEMIGAWDPAVARAYAETIPWKEFGQAEDVANAVAFLASDRARYITGEILDVNGGLLMD